MQLPYHARSRSGADYWGQRLVAACVVLWAGSFAIGFQYALIALVYLSLVTTAAGIFWPRIGLLGLGIAATLDSLARDRLSITFYRFNTLNYLMLLCYFPVPSDCAEAGRPAYTTAHRPRGFAGSRSGL